MDKIEKKFKKLFSLFFEKSLGTQKMNEETVKLYRPVGPKELALLEKNEFKKWPPRLPEQSIFYPVTNERYAIEIASNWNVKESGAGYVTCFEVKASFMEKYPTRQVGALHHTEWWIPAEELDDLNENIVGIIHVLHEYKKSE